MLQKLRVLSIKILYNTKNVNGDSCIETNLYFFNTNPVHYMLEKVGKIDTMLI